MSFKQKLPNFPEHFWVKPQALLRFLGKAASFAAL